MKESVTLLEELRSAAALSLIRSFEFKAVTDLIAGMLRIYIP